MPDPGEAPAPSGPRVPGPEEAELRLALVRQRYGERLTPAEIEELRRACQAQVDAARALRAVPLGDADEPYPPFVPFRAEP